jgi:hypothetical protein
LSKYQCSKLTDSSNYKTKLAKQYNQVQTLSLSIEKLKLLKQVTMYIKRVKSNFLHSRRVWGLVWDGDLYLYYPSCTYVLKSGKIQTHIPSPIKTGKKLLN